MVLSQDWERQDTKLICFGTHRTSLFREDQRVASSFQLVIYCKDSFLDFSPDLRLYLTLLTFHLVNQENSGSDAFC